MVGRKPWAEVKNRMLPWNGIHRRFPYEERNNQSPNRQWARSVGSTTLGKAQSPEPKAQSPN